MIHFTAGDIAPARFRPSLALTEQFPHHFPRELELLGGLLSLSLELFHSPH